MRLNNPLNLLNKTDQCDHLSLILCCLGAGLSREKVSRWFSAYCIKSRTLQRSSDCCHSSCADPALRGALYFLLFHPSFQRSRMICIFPSLLTLPPPCLMLFYFVIMSLFCFFLTLYGLLLPLVVFSEGMCL